MPSWSPSTEALSGFPAQCTLLFEDRAAAFLDMECLAMLGMVLASWLKGKPAPGEEYPPDDFE